MKVRFLNSILFSILLTLTQCVVFPPAQSGGYLFNDFQANFITFPNQEGKEEGRSEGTCILSLVCTGDTSVSTAAQNGKIRKISSVEYRLTSFLFFYSRTTVIVKGTP